MKRKKILHVRHRYLGVTFIFYLVNALTDYDHYFLSKVIDKKDLVKYPFDVKKILTSKINIFLYLNHFYLKIFRSTHFMINDNFLFYRKIKKLQPDIIHAHMGREGYYSIPIAKKFHIPLVTTFYGSDMSDVPKIEYWKKRYVKLFREGSAFIVEGPVMKKKLAEIGCDEKKIFIVPITLPMDEINLFYKTDYTSKNYCKILMVANFVEKKGYKTALKVFDELKRRKFQFSVTIVGDGLLKPEIMNYAKINKNIIVLGRKSIKEVYEIAKAFDIFFHPSETSKTGDSEGGAPTIILEMQMLGLPIVSTMHRDIPNIIPIENHFLAEERDVPGLANTIIDLYQKQDDWYEIAERGRRFVIANHSPENIRKRIDEVYSYIK